MSIQELQKAAGNRAVRGLLGSAEVGRPSRAAPVLRRKTLKDYGLPSGVAESTDTHELVGPTDQGKSGSLPLEVGVFTATTTVTGDRLAAINQSAELNALVGNATSGKTWTEDDSTKFGTTADTLDPFALRTEVEFTADSDKKQLDLVFQHHGKRFPGYIIAIKDTSEGHTGLKHMGPSKDYGAVHEPTSGTGTIASEISGGSGPGLDAYTKLAGEGARWKCVRAHADKLRNDSIFYTGTKGVTFQTLWLSWAHVFGKAYDIEDQTVKDMINSPPTAPTGAKSNVVRAVKRWKDNIISVGTPAEKDFKLR